MDEYIRCTRCGESLPLSAFGMRTDRPARRTQCKSCVAEYYRNRYQAQERARDSRAYYQANKERLIAASVACQKRNPGRKAEAKRRRRAATYGSAVGRVTKQMLRDKSDYWAGRCWVCGGRADTWDHVKPLSKGGPHILANLRPACRTCNSTKGAKWQGPRHLSTN